MAALLIVPVPMADAQTMAVLQGRVVDVRRGDPRRRGRGPSLDNGFSTTATSDGEGRYHLPAIPAGCIK